MEKNEFKLGKYLVKGELGRGAMGVVYRGFDPDIEREVAIKTLHSDLLASGERDVLLERFRKEAQAAGRLNHPGIVQVYEYGLDESQVYIAMELIHGRDLSEYFDEDARFSLGDIVRLMGELLDALGYAHAHGVVHRDIKPSNIVLLEDGHIKVTDFGIARLESSTLTQAGTLLGTPGYMSPEQFMAQRVDGRSDLFSAGVVLYVLLTSEMPFSGNSFATVMHKVLKEDPIPPSVLNITVSPRFDAVVARALAKRPDERYADTEAFKRDLEATLAASGREAGNATAADALAKTMLTGATPATLDKTLLTGVTPAILDKTLLTGVTPATNVPEVAPEATPGSALQPRPVWRLRVGLALGLLALAGGALLVPRDDGSPRPEAAPAALIKPSADRGVVQVRSDPPGAVVIVDEGSFGGVSPASIALPPGIHNLQIRKEGYHDLEASVEVVAGGSIPFEVNLVPVQ
jgi:serine/threonine-protein kinase